MKKVDVTDQYKRGNLATIRKVPIFSLVIGWCLVPLIVWIPVFNVVYLAIWVSVVFVSTIVGAFLSLCPNCGACVWLLRRHPRKRIVVLPGPFHHLSVFECWKCEAILDRDRYESYWAKFEKTKTKESDHRKHSF